ncbi:mechanosensitive ion channel family protein [Catenulispora subtropica]|uniref:Uncharacterized protein n=1 Tax=Catenulispora subtropica TaxID=450798 RepID=A0ABP5E429_9ACTN
MGPRLAISVDWGQGITSAWSSVVNIIPKLIAFAVIMLVGWLICKAIARLVDVVLRRIGVERMAERAGSQRFLAGSKWDATAILTKVVYYGLLLVVLQLALGVFGPNPISDMIHSVVAWLPKLIVAMIIFGVAMALANVVRELVTNILSSFSYGKTLGWIAWAFIAFFGTIAALAQVGIANFVLGPILVAVLATIAGVAVVGVGGGLIQPMRSRWERMLTKAELETVRVASTTDLSAYQMGRHDAEAGLPTAPPTTQQPQQPYGREPGTTA